MKAEPHSSENLADTICLRAKTGHVVPKQRLGSEKYLRVLVVTKFPCYTEVERQIPLDVPCILPL